MSDPKRTLEYLLQLDSRRFVEQQLGAQPWVTVYGDFPRERGKLFSGLVPNDYVAAALDITGWDLMIGHGKPGCTSRYVDGKEVVTYHRLSEARVEPLVIVRDFYGLRPSYLEVSEEFRLFHNLFHDKRTDTYVKFKESGDEEDVIRIVNGEVQIRQKEIRQYLAIREMHLALYFEAIRYSPESLPTLAPAERRVLFKNDLLRYEVVLADARFSTDGSKSLSRLMGKKMIPPLPKEQSNFWPYENRRAQHAEFIIGVDDAGEPVLHSCDPELLSDTFNDRPGAPPYLTPVFFKREVLTKYFAKPSRYEVRDGRLSCAGLWDIQIDTEFKEFVVVFLGDLGRDLPYDDQLYWKAYNVPPEGGISATNFKRSVLAQFADPEHPELVFKMKFEQFRKRWFERFQWDLFKPLAADDAHLFATVRVPLHDDQAEFDPQVLALTKILVDSLNEAEIEKLIPAQPANTKGISKLKVYLEANALPDAQQRIKFLRNLQSLRMGGAHRKGEDYRKAAEAFGVGEKTLREAFETVLTGAIALLDGLEQHFLAAPASPPGATP